MLCKSCGQPLPNKLMNASELLSILKTGTPHRSVYTGVKGGWFVDYGGGEVDPLAVKQLVDEKKIHPNYSDCPDLMYHIGRTWDVARTMAARRDLGKAAPDYFIGDK